MYLKFIKGDLFTSPWSLAHCVSEDLVMSRGIATEFKKRFGNVDCLKQQSGNVRFLIDKDRFIFYLITKEKYFQKPTYSSLQSCLINLRMFMLSNKITNLAIPRLGCGLDKLDWEKVLVIIIDIFKNTLIDIDVYF